MKSSKGADPFLEKRVVKYDRWLGQKQISYSSKVIPVSESIDAKQWVLQTDQAIDILRNARTISVQKCVCRMHYQKCDNPVEVCLLLNEVGDKAVSNNQACRVSLSEVIDILKKANDHGLVHLSLYMPDHQVFALCSCCSCCCHDLQIAKIYKRRDLVVGSGYVAITAPEICVNCGECIERCVFGARRFRDEIMEYSPDACFGCGLCVTVCPVEATSMALQNKGQS